jgi:apurinic endonuclease APN1
MNKNITTRLGYNINTSLGLASSADYAQSLGCTFYQIFLSSPQQFNSKRRPPTELAALKERLETLQLGIVVHGSYMLNFCNPTDSKQHKQALRLLINDLEDSTKINAIGVIIHMGKQLELTLDTAINNYVTGIQTALKRTTNSTIILETGAGQGTEICTSIFALGKLYNKFTNDEKQRIKFCIDTCHVFSAGYSIGDSAYVDLFCDIIDTHLGWQNIVCIHLNDSKCEVNSKKDRHADITKGFIATDGLKKFICVCAKKNIPIVLETPCDVLSKKEQLDLVQGWLQL